MMDLTKVRSYYLACGYTDLRLGIDGLATVVTQQLRVPEQPRAVGLHRAYMVGVLMGDENLADGLGVDAQPAHFLLQPVVVVARVDHDGGIALAVEEDICHLLPDTGDVFINPAGVQGLENLLATVHPAHFLFLKFGCPSGHAHPPLSYVIARLSTGRAE